MIKLLFFPALLLILFGLVTASNGQNPPILGSVDKRQTHPSIFFDKDTFWKGIYQVEKEHQESNYFIAGGIIPHHLFPSFIIADFFKKLSLQGPSTIILIGPNHYERGNFKALTSIDNWQTPFGIVEPNDFIISSLRGHNLMKIDEEVLTSEHSVAGIMPFIKFYLPNSKVVPIILSGTMTMNETELLANNLKGYLKDDTIIVASVDFSHYLTSKLAQEKDEITIQTIKDFNISKLFTLNNDYLDSPPSIAVLLLAMQKLEKTNLEIIHHTNSGILQKDDSIETTSYLSAIFY